MKNPTLIITFIILSVNIAFAEKNNIDDIKANILGTIAQKLTGKKEPAIYTENIPSAVYTILKQQYDVVYNCQDADLAIISSEGEKLTKQCSKLPVFINGSKYSQNYPEQTIGWFYWKKGRPNITIKCKKLDKFNLQGHIDEKYCE